MFKANNKKKYKIKKYKKYSLCKKLKNWLFIKFLLFNLLKKLFLIKNHLKASINDVIFLKTN